MPPMRITHGGGAGGSEAQTMATVPSDPGGNGALGGPLRGRAWDCLETCCPGPSGLGTTRWQRRPRTRMRMATKGRGGDCCHDQALLLEGGQGGNQDGDRRDGAPAVAPPPPCHRARGASTLSSATGTSQMRGGRGVVILIRSGRREHAVRAFGPTVGDL
jgi:hypothetical protein